MAKQERYIDADALIEKLRLMAMPYPSVSTSYSNSNGLDYALSQAINAAVPNAIHNALIIFQQQLIKAVEETATLKGTPCFLCKQRDGEETPPNMYGGCGKAA